MKKIFFIILSVILTVAVCGCQSNVDKANKLIDKYMYTHLHDYKSYEPIETKIDTLFNNPVTDIECMSIARELKKHIENIEEYEDDAEHDHRTMDIWSGGWSSTSRSEYKKAYKSWVKNKRKVAEENVAILGCCKSLLNKMAVLDGKTQIGWIADHSFRSNNLGGNSSLANYAFYIDMGFNAITSTLDEEDSEMVSSMPDALGIALRLGPVEHADSLIAEWQELILKYDSSLSNLD